MDGDEGSSRGRFVDCVGAVVGEADMMLRFYGLISSLKLEKRSGRRMRRSRTSID